jgi:DNA mismatch repair ATPase MutS
LTGIRAASSQTTDKMSFTIDKQTQEDLNLLGKFKKNSIINLFNRTCTRKGELLLESMFLLPLTDPDEINKRSRIIQYFQQLHTQFPVPPALYGHVLSYLESSSSSRLGTIAGTISKKIAFLAIGDNGYETVCKGISSLIEMLGIVEEFVKKIEKPDSPYREQIEDIKGLFDKKLSERLKKPMRSHFSFFHTLYYDSLFRYTYRRQLNRLIQVLSEIDVYISVSDVAREKKLCYAAALTREHHSTRIEGLFHPSLTSPVTNSVSIERDKNVIFLTGANMAGKSTFMKSYGIAVYLAHMGFPVPAAQMTFSVLEGMYTSINLPDNLSLGYSHFYAEVLRVKQAAREVGSSKDMLVIFDELFKGTNVKDAFDATVAVTRAFGRWDNCQFIISTHIVEAGEMLRDNSNMQFLYLPTKLDHNRPVYTYKIEQGISGDRHGMMIIRNERIVETIMNKASME